ncbi:hypothetical protein Glove_290g51 [Diversispora epigaea]|uniref:Uncharacterized protein n=1 Tax=Diversispora epigaea TaxID=1348612 RepID=A0A397I8F8_9GLOM|nr:hypothetical protein Glove_290g51 [Diversispora epigaea]
MKRQISEVSEESEVSCPRKRIIIKRSKDVQERINEERRMAVVKANEILLPLFNSRKNKVTFETPPPISKVLIKKREGGKGKGVEEGEKIKGSKERVLEEVDEILRPLMKVKEAMKVEIKIPQISMVPIKKRKFAKRK